MIFTNQSRTPSQNLPTDAMIVVCAWCKQKVFSCRLWHSANKDFIEALALTTDVDVSHGICPECAKQMSFSSGPQN